MVAGYPCWKELPRRSVGRTGNGGQLTEKNEIDCPCKCVREWGVVVVLCPPYTSKVMSEWSVNWAGLDLLSSFPVL